MSGWRERECLQDRLATEEEESRGLSARRDALASLPRSAWRTDAQPNCVLVAVLLRDGLGLTPPFVAFLETGTANEGDIVGKSPDGFNVVLGWLPVGE